jgi:hypothetical protein
MPDTSLIYVAIIGFLGQIVATIGASYLQQRSAKKAVKEATDVATLAASNATKAQVATSTAARDAANAARALVEAAKATDERLDDLRKSADENMAVTDETHKIVNSQRTAMEERIEEMRGTIDAMQKKIEYLVRGGVSKCASRRAGGIMGNFHKISRKYLPLYVAEFECRYNNRNNPDIFSTAIVRCLLDKTV